MAIAIGGKSASVGGSVCGCPGRSFGLRIGTKAGAFGDLSAVVAQLGSARKMLSDGNDDGVGGADISAESGLTDCADRIRALGRGFTAEIELNGGTTVKALVPLCVS